VLAGVVGSNPSCGAYLEGISGCYGDSLTTKKPIVIELKQPRTHAISDDWNNLPSIVRYTPQEFRKKIFGVDDKTTTTIYQILRTFREGTQLKKTPDLNMPISTLVKDSERSSSCTKC
jgi:hypothetical protein